MIASEKERTEWQIAPCLSGSKNSWILQSRTPPNNLWTPVLYTTSIKRAKSAFAHMMRKPIKLR